MTQVDPDSCRHQFIPDAEYQVTCLLKIIKASFSHPNSDTEIPGWARGWAWAVDVSARQIQKSLFLR